jgi:DNA-binding CsgD family transcriptional regulator
MDRQENSIEFDLTRYLSSFDMKILLEIAYLSIAYENPNPMEIAFKKMQSIISFRQSMFVCDSLVENLFDRDFIFWGVCESLIQDYFGNKKYMVDPIGREIRRTMNCIDISKFYEKNRALQANPVVQIFYDYHLKTGFADIICDYQNLKIYSVACYGFPSKIKQRVKAVIQYLLPFFSTVYRKNIEKKINKAKSFSLTKKEIEVLNWLKEGKSSWEISMILNIGESTVNFHVTNIMRKLNATRRTQAVAIALSQGLIEL